MKISKKRKKTTLTPDIKFYRSLDSGMTVTEYLLNGKVLVLRKVFDWRVVTIDIIVIIRTIVSHREVETLRKSKILTTGLLSMVILILVLDTGYAQVREIRSLKVLGLVRNVPAAARLC